MYKKKINKNTTVCSYGYEYKNTKGVALRIYGKPPIVYLEDLGNGELSLGINYELCQELGIAHIPYSEVEEDTLPCTHSENGECTLSPDAKCTGSQEEQEECSYR